MRSFSPILFVIALCFNAQAELLDSISIKNFGTGDYKAASANYTVVIDELGVLYFANENGILKYDGSEWELIPITDFGGVYSITLSDDGKFYIGGVNEYGYLERDSSDNFVYHSLRSSLTKQHEFGAFWQIQALGQDIYFASYEGLVQYDGESSRHIDITNSGIFVLNNELVVSKFDGYLYTILGDSSELLNDQYKWKNDNVFAVMQCLTDDSFIFSTSENGLYKYFPDRNEMMPFTTSDDAFLKENGIYDAHIFRDSLYAFSSWTAGLIIMDKNGQILSKVDKSEGMHSNALHDFVIDKRGHIWAGRPTGISYIQWSTDYIRDGYVPKTYITKVRSKYDEDNNLRLLEFRFATPGYDKSDIQYSYYLDGYDEGFGDWSQDVKKEYTNLDGGNYTFKVKAKLPSGQTTEMQIHSFTVPTPWYQTKAFIFSAILVVSAFIFLMFRYRTKRLKLLNKRLERIINNRTQELIEQRERIKLANDELILTNTELDNFVYRSSHDLVAPLKSLKGLINLAMAEEPNERQSEYLKMMNSSVAKLEDFIKSIMEYSINSKREVAKEDVFLDNIIESICQDLQYYDNSDRVKLIRNYDRNLILKSDESRLKIVLSNLITNCIKYHNYNQESPKIVVNVDLNYAKGISVIEILDNGMGIAKEHLDKIFDMFFRASSDKAEGSGLGLYIVKDTVTKIGGQIDVESEIGNGTVFKITLYDSLQPVSKQSV
ncbi:MAG: ATP-binding protein [Fulvivirga sp.]|uniref:ATP-binding protein n=1 Tax=Fulvivirga sp. TaxID=1931237 RepID=UPI0032EF355E